MLKYEEMIHELKPIPKFNLQWYKEQDLYSDGDVEETIIKLISENEPEHYKEAIYNNFNWPVYYHLTHLRKNILNWYPFRKNSNVLEIGCGMGAITNLLCEKCDSVTAVELSKRRAAGALLRCRKRDNLEIIVGNLNDIQFDRKFDYITLIGVLEYQGTYTNSENPYLDFLNKIKTLLKPNGVLLIAIENKYGLKYWCGAREDHTQIPFDGINQYSVSSKNVKTFSKTELDQLVGDCGFANRFFYYPMPDYKLPSIIYSQQKLPDQGNIQNLKTYYTPDRSTLIADELALYPDIIENGVFEFFANSFLVECTDSNCFGKITCAVLNAERMEQHRIATLFTNQGTVEKIPLHHSSHEHIRQTLKNQEILDKRGINVWRSQLANETLISEYTSAQLLLEYVLNAYQQREVDKIFEIIDIVYQEILNSSEHIPASQNILYALGLDKNKDNDHYGPILKVGYIDMVFKNAFYKEPKIYWFDQEWVLEAVPASYILYRGFLVLYNEHKWVNNILPIDTLIERYKITAAREIYFKLENLFFASISDKYDIVNQVFRGVDQDICTKNIRTLLTPSHL